MSAKNGWTKTGSLEWRKTINGAQCVVHRVKHFARIIWSCSIHRDDEEVHVTYHPTHWAAMKWAERPDGTKKRTKIFAGGRP